MNTVFKSYRDKAVEFGILKSFSTLANNFFVIMSKLQASVSRTKLGWRSTGDAVLSEDSFPSPYLALAFIPCQGAAGVMEQGKALDWVSICKVVNLFLQTINLLFI